MCVFLETQTTSLGIAICRFVFKKVIAPNQTLQTVIRKLYTAVVTNTFQSEAAGRIEI